MRLFVVLEGAYSSLGLEAVFSSRENADAFIASFAQGGDWTVKEVDLDVPLAYWERGLRSYDVHFTAKGDGHAHWATTPEPNLGEQGRLDVRMYGSPDGGHSTHVWAKDEAHAVKIASERRAAWLAHWPLSEEGPSV